jgi:hypothetical protein
MPVFLDLVMEGHIVVRLAMEIWIAVMDMNVGI